MKAAAVKVKKGARPAAAVTRAGFWENLGSRDSLALGAILAVTALIYLRCLSNGYVFDDHEMIIANRYIGEWSFLWKALVNDSWWFRDPLHLPQSHYYRPLQDIWLGLNYQLFGLNPVGPHALMVGLHLVAVVFAYWIAMKLTADRVAGLIAALFFGLLPVHAEAVIWATAIPESMAGTLQLGAFYFYLRYRQDGFKHGLTWSSALFAGALLSHESAIAFPLLVGAHALLFPKEQRAGAKDYPHPSPIPGQGEGTEIRREYFARGRDALLLAAPFVAVAILYLSARLAVLGFIARRDVNNQASLAQIILTIPTVIVHNLADIINPWQAGPSHRIIWIDSPWSADLWMPVLGLDLLAAAGLIAVIGSPRRRIYLFGVAWVFIAMAPVLNLGILYPNALVADRYLYFSSFGVCLLAGQLVAVLAQAYPAMARPVAAAAALIAAIYGLTLWQVQHFWHDEITLFSRCIERFPDSGFCHNRLGMALQAVGELKGAEQELALALKLDPSDYAAEYDLAMVHAQQGLYAQAARESNHALDHLSNPPASAWVGLAEMYQRAGDPKSSETAFARAEKLPGGVTEAALGRARISLEHKDGAGAERLLKPLLASTPNDPRALLMLGSALAVQQRYGEALEAYQDAQRMVPDDLTVRFLIALTLHNLGRDQEALAQCEMVLRKAPANANAQALLRAIERGLGEKQKMPG